MQVTGKVTYNGAPLAAFVPEQTAAYVDQTDLHTPELTVRETLDFAARCQHTGFGGRPPLPQWLPASACASHSC